jgi:hypothetical protein
MFVASGESNIKFSLLLYEYPRTSIPTELVMLVEDKPSVFQVTSCFSPTCHIVPAVGLVMGGSTTSLKLSGSERANDARDEMVNKRFVNTNILLKSEPKARTGN